MAGLFDCNGASHHGRARGLRDRGGGAGACNAFEVADDLDLDCPTVPVPSASL